jgi:hypothetical protein
MGTDEGNPIRILSVLSVVKKSFTQARFGQPPWVSRRAPAVPAPAKTPRRASPAATRSKVPSPQSIGRSPPAQRVVRLEVAPRKSRAGRQVRVVDTLGKSPRFGFGRSDRVFADADHTHAPSDVPVRPQQRLARPQPALLQFVGEIDEKGGIKQHDGAPDGASAAAFPAGAGAGRHPPSAGSSSIRRDGPRCRNRPRPRQTPDAPHRHTTRVGLSPAATA